MNAVSQVQIVRDNHPTVWQPNRALLCPTISHRSSGLSHFTIPTIRPLLSASAAGKEPAGSDRQHGILVRPRLTRPRHPASDPGDGSAESKNADEGTGEPPLRRRVAGMWSGLGCRTSRLPLLCFYHTTEHPLCQLLELRSGALNAPCKDRKPSARIYDEPLALR